MNIKKIMAATAGASVFFGVSSAYAASGIYVSVDGGVAIASDMEMANFAGSNYNLWLETDTGVGMDVGVGYAINDIVRVEAEIDYQSNDINSISYGTTGRIGYEAEGEITATTYSINGYCDFANASPITPFVMAGIGIATVEFKDLRLSQQPYSYYTAYPSSSNEDDVFAFKIGAGIGYQLNEKITIDLSYRYTSFDDPEYNSITAEYDSHNIYAGIRFAF